MKITLVALKVMSWCCKRASLALLTLVALSDELPAQSSPPEIYEGFDYPAGTLLNSTNGSFPGTLSNSSVQGANGGAGWSGSWGYGAGTAGNRVTVEGSLAYSGVTSVGNKLEIEGSRIFRRFDTDLTAGNTYYVSVLMQRDSTDGANTYMGLMLANDMGQEKLLIGTGSNYTTWMIAGNVGTGAGLRVPEDHSLYNVNQSNALVSQVANIEMAMLLVKVELRDVDAETNPEGLERVTFWLNPDLSKPEREFTALGGQSFLSNTDYGNLRWVRLGSGSSGTDGLKHWVDELRISQTSPFAAGPEIVVEEPGNTRLDSGASTDLGKVQLGQPQARTYTLRNQGTADLTNLSFAFTGDAAADFTASSLPASLAPGASATFTVTFTPAALGTREALLTLNSNDPFLAAFTLNLSGEGATPRIVVEQPADTALINGGNVGFDSSPLGTPVALTFTLKNTGTLPLTELAAGVTGAAAADYAVSPLLVTELDAGATTTLTVTFTPSDFGLRSATLSIGSNDPVNGTFTLALSGVGGAPVLVVEQPAGTPLVNGEASVDFGSTRIGAPVTRAFTLRNEGIAALENLEITFTGTAAGAFSLVPLAFTELAPDAEATFTVRFNPLSSGSQTATLTLASNDPETPSFTVVLTGTGQGVYGVGKPVVLPESEKLPSPAEVISWEDSAAGLYDGLLYRQDGSLAGALEALKVTKGKSGGGSASGTLRLKGQKVNLGGLMVDNNGRLTGIVPHKEGDIQFNLQLQKTTTEVPVAVLRGTVIWGGFTVTADLSQSPYGAGSPAPVEHTGTFTLLLPVADDRQAGQPGGDGWATVTISSTGAVKLAGVLGDGTKFTESAYLSSQGEFSIFAELYKTKPEKGCIGGRFTFRSLEGVSDLDGKVRWRKLADSKEAAYPQGFDLECWAIGSRYTVPAAGEYLLADLKTAEPNATLSLWNAQPVPVAPSHTGLGGEAAYAVSWKNNHQLVHYGPEKLTAKANKGNGTLTGSFSSLAGGKSLALAGVVFQKQNLAAGTFIVPGGSGLFRIKPEDSPSFPGSESPGPLSPVASPATDAVSPASSGVALDANATGTYGGVLTDDTGKPVGALENLLLNGATGNFSATLWYQGIKHPVTGQLDAEGRLTTPITLAAGLVLDLHLEQVDGGGSRVLKGGLTDGGVELSVDAQIRQPGLSAKQGSAFAGIYTLVVEGPAGQAGHGYGSLTIDAAGLGKGTLVLADGSKTTFAGHVSKEGEWSFHRGLYGKQPKGYLAGKLTFRAQAGVSDLDGQWRWVKNADAQPANLDLGGFDRLCEVVGSAYTKPGKSERALAGLASYYNAWVRLEGANLAAAGHPAVDAVNRVITWNTKNTLLYYGVDKLSLKFNAASGLVTGSYQDSARGIKLTFAGALLQRQGLVAGFYLSPSAQKSGVFLIEPREAAAD